MSLFSSFRSLVSDLPWFLLHVSHTGMMGYLMVYLCSYWSTVLPVFLVFSYISCTLDIDYGNSVPVMIMTFLISLVAKQIEHNCSYGHNGLTQRLVYHPIKRIFGWYASFIIEWVRHRYQTNTQLYTMGSQIFGQPMVETFIGLERRHLFQMMFNPNHTLLTATTQANYTTLAQEPDPLPGHGPTVLWDLPDPQPEDPPHPQPIWGEEMIDRYDLVNHIHPVPEDHNVMDDLMEELDLVDDPTDEYDATDDFRNFPQAMPTGAQTAISLMSFFRTPGASDGC